MFSNGSSKIINEDQIETETTVDNLDNDVDEQIPMIYSDSEEADPREDVIELD